YTFTNNWPYRMDLNETSSLTAHELRYGSLVSEAVFVNSISYDGSSDVWNDPLTPTSVWGPLRNRIITGASNVRFGAVFNKTKQMGFSGGVYSAADKSGVLDTV